MKKLFVILLFMSAFISNVTAQVTEKKYTVFDGRGNKTDLRSIIEAAGKSDVVFLGESHDDSVAHALQFEIFSRAFEEYGKKRNVVLSLEMFERDVQTVLDEYLQNLITETHFLAAARPWGNYQTDYRPLVEFAKENKLRVIAANAPRRYVNMVSRLGRNSLENLPPGAEKWIAPLPYGEASEEYQKKFRTIMGGHGSENLLDSQSLWDATMAYSIAENFEKLKNPLFINLNGSFHTETRLGTVEHLLKYKPKAKVLVVTMYYVDDFMNFDESKHKAAGDFVILTDAKQPRSRR